MNGGEAAGEAPASPKNGKKEGSQYLVCPSQQLERL